MLRFDKKHTIGVPRINQQKIMPKQQDNKPELLKNNSDANPPAI